MTTTPEKLEYVPWPWGTRFCVLDRSGVYDEMGRPDTLGQTVAFERPGRGTITHTLRYIHTLREPYPDGVVARSYEFSFELPQ